MVKVLGVDFQDRMNKVFNKKMYNVSIKSIVKGVRNPLDIEAGISSTPTTNVFKGLVSDADSIAKDKYPEAKYCVQILIGSNPSITIDRDDILLYSVGNTQKEFKIYEMCKDPSSSLYYLVAG